MTHTTTSKLADLLADYLEYLELERGYASRTISDYHRGIQRFLAWSGRSEAEELSEELVRKYRLYLNRYAKPVSKQRAKAFPIASDSFPDNFRKISGTSDSFPVQGDAEISVRTRNHYLITIRQFLKYLERRKISSLSPDLVELAKEPEREISFLEPEELARLLDATKGNSAVSARDRAILETLFSTGLRVSELCRLTVATINLATNEFHVKGKGGKIRVVFLSDRAAEALARYVESRKDILEPALFVSFPRKKAKRGVSSATEHHPLTTRSIQRIVRKYATKAGISGKRVTPHTLRHSLATDLLRSGADLRSVQEILGHAHVGTTQIYTHVTDLHLKEIHKKFHGKSLQGQ